MLVYTNHIFHIWKRLLEILFIEISSKNTSFGLNTLAFIYLFYGFAFNIKTFCDKGIKNLTKKYEYFLVPTGFVLSRARYDQHWPSERLSKRQIDLHSI